jgi:hypothetical protein
MVAHSDRDQNGELVLCEFVNGSRGRSRFPQREHRIDASRTIDDVLRGAANVLRERLKSEVVRFESRAA